MLGAMGALVLAGCAAPDGDASENGDAKGAPALGEVAKARDLAATPARARPVSMGPRAAANPRALNVLFPWSDGRAESEGARSERVAVSHAGAQAMLDAFPQHGARVIDGGSGVDEAGGVFRAREMGARGAKGLGRAAAAGGRISDAARVSVTLPGDSDEGVRMQVGALEIRVREDGLRGRGAIVDRAVAYERAGGTAFWTVSRGGAEEWLHVSKEAVRAGEPVATWEVEGASLWDRGDAVALRDEDGVSRMWVTAPEAYAKDGRRVAARLSVKGSAGGRGSRGGVDRSGLVGARADAGGPRGAGDGDAREREGARRRRGGLGLQRAHERRGV